MGKDSAIEWTDHTFNPWIGCTKVSPGCTNCYAETLMDKRMGKAKWGPGNPRSRTSPGNWKKPEKWNSTAHSERTDLFYGQLKEDGKIVVPWEQTPKPRVFCASLSDWLDHEVPVEWLADLLELIARTPHLDWLLLSKRIEDWRGRMNDVAQLVQVTKPYATKIARAWLDGHAPENVWVGTTVEDQQRATARIPALLAVPARVRFLSCEPMVGEVDLRVRGFVGGRTSGIGGQAHGMIFPKGIHWVICGGESGSNARPMHVLWARSLRDQCAAAGVPFFFKQWGEWTPGLSNSDDYASIHDGTKTIIRGARSPFHRWGEGYVSVRVGKKKAGRLVEGVLHHAFPEVVKA